MVEMTDSNLSLVKDIAPFFVSLFGICNDIEDIDPRYT